MSQEFLCIFYRWESTKAEPGSGRGRGLPSEKWGTEL